MSPARYIFECGGDADAVFAASVKSVRAHLEQGGRININQAMLLLAARAVESLARGASEEEARQSIADLLSPEQVMIGVPEMARHLDMEMETTSGTVRLYIHNPFAPAQARHYAKKPVS